MPGRVAEVRHDHAVLVPDGSCGRGKSTDRADGWCAVWARRYGVHESVVSFRSARPGANGGATPAPGRLSVVSLGPCLAATTVAWGVTFTAPGDSGDAVWSEV